MRFSPPLFPAKLIRRYKRFLADIEICATGERLTVLCPNTGSMLGLTAPGSIVWVSQSANPSRKYRFTWELIEVDLGAGPTLVGINTANPNALVAEAIAAERIGEISGYGSLRREVKYGENSRIDFLLEGGADDRPCYVEVKNVHMMRRAGLAEFPDSRTDRGTKHLRELSLMVAQGCRAVMLYLVQRSDAESFALAHDVDPAYASAFVRAEEAGVEMLCYRCRMSADEIAVDRRIDIAPSSWAIAMVDETKGRHLAYPKREKKKPKPR